MEFAWYIGTSLSSFFLPDFTPVPNSVLILTLLMLSNAGVSRAATICIAYIMKKFKLSVEDATETVSDVRPDICPNPGFKRQLEQYYENLHPELKKKAPEPVATPAVETKKEEEIATNLAQTSIAPSEPTTTPTDPISEVAQVAEEEKKDMKEVVEEKTVYSCRMCRRPLFFAEDIMPHQVSKHDISYRKRDKGNAVSSDFVTCNSHFLQEPLQWMGVVDENEGKICCSKCQSRIGFWKWDGQQCSCGTWVTPAIQIAKNRVDERVMPVSTMVPV